MLISVAYIYRESRPARRAEEEARAARPRARLAEAAAERAAGSGSDEDETIGWAAHGE